MKGIWSVDMIDLNSILKKTEGTIDGLKIINYEEMSGNDAKKYFREAYRLFGRAINNNECLYNYNLPFSWGIVEERHKDNVCNEDEGCDFYFIDFTDRDNVKSFSLDISHDIEGFGYDSQAFRRLYGDIYDDLYCCEVCTYRDCFDYDNRLNEVIFLYDKKNNRVVEVLSVLFNSIIIGNRKTIRRVEDVKVLKRIIN